MSKKIAIDDLTDIIIGELQDYSEEIMEDVKKSVKKVAKECVSDIKEKAPENTGDYKKGWKTKITFESSNDIRVTVHNSKKPQLTHLLEHGHAKVNGGRVEGKEHIRPAEQRAESKLLKQIKEAIG